MYGGFDEYPGHPDSTVAHRCIRGCDVFCVPHNGQNVEEALDHFRIYCRLVCPIHSAFSSGMGGIATRFRSTQFRKLHQASCPARTHLLRSEQACTESKPAPKTNLHQEQTRGSNHSLPLADCHAALPLLLFGPYEVLRHIANKIDRSSGNVNGALEHGFKLLGLAVVELGVL